MARKTLTDKGVAALKPRAKLYAHADPQMPGHYVRVTPAGAKSFAVMARDPRGKQVLQTIGSASMIGIEEARAKARETIAAIKAGADRAGPQSFQAIAEEWFKRHVAAKDPAPPLRSDAISTSIFCPSGEAGNSRPSGAATLPS